MSDIFEIFDKITYLDRKRGKFFVKRGKKGEERSPRNHFLYSFDYDSHLKWPTTGVFTLIIFLLDSETLHYKKKANSEFV